MLTGADVPVVATPETAPEIAVFSAIAHGDGPAGFEVALAALAAVARIDEDRSAYYTSLILAALGSAARARLEEEMRLGNFPEPTELERRIFRRGQIEGRVEGRAEAVLTVLASRGLVIDPERRARIASCSDEDQLSRWLARVATVATTGELFD
ncbi:MAG: hypothetical protein AB7S26_19765 [Sandaracinaceae bacterium]